MRRTYRTLEEIRVLVEVAAGRRPADLYLDGATLVNVYSGEVYPANVAVAGRRIAYVGPGRAMVGPDTLVLSLHGRVLAPGYVEPHTHITGMANPAEYAREGLRTGTTALLADTLLLMLHTPRPLLPALLRELADMPVLIAWSLRLEGSSYLPGDEAVFALDHLASLLEMEEVRAVGEVMHWPAVYRGDGGLLRRIALAQAAGRRIEGHAPGVSADRLQALGAAGWSSDHEAITPEEVVNRLRAGMFTMLRHSSLRPDVPLLAPAVTAERARTGRLMLTADGPDAVTVADCGHMDFVIREAITAGIPPVLAYQMATVNPAAYLGLDEEIGGIGPGRRADIVVLDDLRNPTPELVLARGQIAAREGRCVAEFPGVEWTRYFPPQFRPDWDPQPALFEMPAGPAVDGSAGADREEGAPGGAGSAAAAGGGAVIRFPVIRLENSVITRRVDLPMPVVDGRIQPPPEAMRLALVDARGGWIVRGAIANFATRLGGLASSFNVIPHMTVMGQDTADMARAARRLLEIGGGIVAVERGEIAVEIPLPVGGVMSPEPFATVAGLTRDLYAFLREHGYPHLDPHHTLHFLTLDSLPDIRITYRGVWDVRRGKALISRQDL